MFVQSHVPAHAELAWVLNCYTMYGELSRMTQFKDKSAKNAQNINAGLFTYPALMAADILLYGTDIVPVGIDQKQHVELARDIAERFNQIYGDTFTIPDPWILQTGKKIYSLAEPEKKMSKSDENVNSFIGILDPRDVIIKKFKRAVTDSDTHVCYAEGKNGINNLMTIYSCFTGKTMEEIEREFDGKGYGEFKLAVGEACADALAPIQAQYNCLMSDRSYLEGVLSQNADYAAYLARKMLSKVYKKVGFLAKNK
jgi:tryptophanyl-tRNA synthetase